MQHQDFDNLFKSYTLVQTMNAEIDKFKKNMNDIDSDNSLFYSIEDIQKMTGWSKRTVENLFNNPAFPSTDIGRKKLILKFRFIDFFSTRRAKSEQKYWR